MRRGDIVTMAGVGDFSGKPRPGLIVQQDDFCIAHTSLSVLPITSVPQEPLMFRVAIPADAGTGLKRASAVMVDKLQSVRRDRIGEFIGRADLATMQRVDDALRLWLAL